MKIGLLFFFGGVGTCKAGLVGGGGMSDLGPFWLCKRKEQGNQYRKVCSVGQMFTAGSQEQQIWFKRHAVKKHRL